jgi:hypothetical protein
MSEILHVIVDGSLDPIDDADDELLEPVLVASVEGEAREEVERVSWSRAPRARVGVGWIGGDKGVKEAWEVG